MVTIKYSESLKSGIVCTNLTHWSDKIEILFFYLHNVFLLGLLLVLPTYMIIKEYFDNTIGGLSLIFEGTEIILGSYLLICLFNWRRLTKIERLEIERNKELLIPIINGYYPGLNYEWDGEILIGTRPYSNFNFKGGLNIVVIFSKSDIYLNILSIYRPGPNPWMAFTNIERAAEIKDMFKEKIRYSQMMYHTEHIKTRYK